MNRPTIKILTTKEYERNNLKSDKILFEIIFVCIIVTFFIGMFIGYELHRNTYSVDIPDNIELIFNVLEDHKLMSEYCREKGFKDGYVTWWFDIELDVSKNAVRCYHEDYESYEYTLQEYSYWAISSGGVSNEP